MKIRLIVPQCGYFLENKYSKDSWDYEKRLEILEKAINIAQTDLIVTSNNFLAFDLPCFANAKDFIVKKIMPMLNKGVSQKIPLVLGFDLFGEKAPYNPYDGIDSVVCFLDVKNDYYEYRTHIWECWRELRKCDQKGFSEQNKNRIFTLRDTKFGLLSCGDVAMYCHNKGKLLPEVDVYLDLSHRSLPGHCSQRQISPRLIDEFQKCSYVFVTQNVGNQTINRYYRERNYPYIFPENNSHHVRKLLIGRETVGALIDIDI